MVLDPALLEGLSRTEREEVIALLAQLLLEASEAPRGDGNENV